jgi:hypothetical protein
MKIRALAFIIFLFASCKIKPDGKDVRGYWHYVDVCVKSHTENYTQPVLIGKIWMSQPRVRTVCDQYQTVKEYIPLEDVLLD